MKPLSSTHLQVCKLVALGLNSKEVSHSLHMPVGTVNNMRCHVLRYYDCHNAVQLAHLMLHNKQINNIYK